MSKYMFEEYAKKSKITIPLQIFRYFNVYGPHEDHKGNQASPYYQFTKQAKETGIIRVFEGSENFKRDFVHVDTVVNKHIEHIRYMCQYSSATFNVGSGYARSFMDVAKDIDLLHEARIEIIPFPEHLRRHYQTYTCADLSAAL